MSTIRGVGQREILWDDFSDRFLDRIPAGGTVLEVGAGPGLLAKRILDDRPDLRLIVTDYSPQMLDLARANLERSSADTEEAEKHRDRF